MQKNRIKLLVAVLMVIACIGNVGTIKCQAESIEDVKLYTVWDDEKGKYSSYDLGDMLKIPVNATVTINADHPEVASITCSKTTVKRKGDDYDEEDIELNVPFMLDSSHIVADNAERGKLAEGEWYADFFIKAKKAGVTVITVVAQRAGEEVYNKTYRVTVEGVKPKISIDKTKLRTCDEACLSISDISCAGAAVTLSTDKDKVVKVIYSVNEKGKIREKSVWVGKNPIVIPEEPDDCMLYIYPYKAKNVILNVSVEQDGLPAETKVCKLNVTKYQNPFKTFKIGSVDYAKYFKNNDELASKDRSRRHFTLSKKLCKNTQGGKSFQYSMKKGYQLVSIKYVPAGEWNVKPTMLRLQYGKSGFGVFPKSFWEMYIVYKDKKGKKHTNYIWF